MAEKENNDIGWSQNGLEEVNGIMRQQIQWIEERITVNHEHELEQGTGEKVGKKYDVFIKNDADLELTEEKVWQRREETLHHTPLGIIED